MLAFLLKYQMDKIQKVVDLVNRLGCSIRLKPKEYPLETWTSGIGLPTDNYIEIHGPWAFREVEWFEINPVVMEYIGKLAKPKPHAYLSDIVSLLQLEVIPYSIIEEKVRVQFIAFE